MCGIAALQIRNPALRDSLGALMHGMLCEIVERGPDSAGLALYGSERLTPSGSSAITVIGAADADDARRAALTRVAPRRAASPPSSTYAESLLINAAVDAPVLERAVRAALPDAHIIGRGSNVAVLKGVGHPVELAETVSPHRDQRHAGALAHPDGDRVRRHGGRRTPVHRRRGPVPRAQRILQQPRVDPPLAARRGRRVRQRERLRGRRPVHRVAHGPGRRSDDRPRDGSRRSSTASTRSSSPPRTAWRSCATPSRASPRSSPRPTTGSPWHPNTAPSPGCPASRTHASSSPPPASSTPGASTSPSWKEPPA